MKRSTAGHDRVIGGRGIGRRYIKRKEMDDEWTGLGLYRAQQGHLSRLMAYTSRATTATNGTSPFALAGTLFCNHSQAPVSPPVSYQVTHRRTLSAIDGAPSHIIIRPFMLPSRWGCRSRSVTLWARPLQGCQLTAKSTCAYPDNDCSLPGGSIKWALGATNDYSYYYSPTRTSDGVKVEDGRTPPSWA